VPQTSAVGSLTQAPQYAAPPFVCSWETGAWGAAWVQVAGELDLATSPQFRQMLGEAQRDARVVVLDLRELCYIDSSGVHVILDAARDQRRRAGRLLIVRGPAPVDRVLTLTEVGEQVVIFDLAPTEPAPALLHVLPPGVAA
jgi:anti-sigma B factor antagonist